MSKHLLSSTHHFRFLLPDRVPELYKRIIVQYLGVKREDIIHYNDLAEVIHVPRLVVPSMLWVHPRVSSKMNSFINDLTVAVCGLERKRGVDLPDRFVISREGFRPPQASPGSRFMENPEQIWSIAQNFGLSVVHPETLPWDDQLNLFRNARLVIGETGSGLHNAMFSGSDATIMALGNSQSNLIQSAIAALRQQRIGYIFPLAEYSFPSGGIGFSYDPQLFSERLEEVLALTS